MDDNQMMNVALTSLYYTSEVFLTTQLRSFKSNYNKYFAFIDNKGALALLQQ